MSSITKGPGDKLKLIRKLSTNHFLFFLTIYMYVYRYLSLCSSANTFSWLFLLLAKTPLNFWKKSVEQCPNLHRTNDRDWNAIWESFFIFLFLHIFFHQIEEGFSWKLIFGVGFNTLLFNFIISLEFILLGEIYDSLIHSISDGSFA